MTFTYTRLVENDGWNNYKWTDSYNMCTAIVRIIFKNAFRFNLRVCGFKNFSWSSWLATQGCVQVLKSSDYINLQNLWSLISMLKQCLGDSLYIRHIYTYIAMCCVKQLAIRIKYFHSCWYFSNCQWVCSGGYFIWVVVGADHCGHIPGCPQTLLAIACLHTGYAKHSFLICLTNAV